MPAHTSPFRGFRAIGVCLYFGAAMAFLAGTTLLWRGTLLDRLWILNPGHSTSFYLWELPRALHFCSWRDSGSRRRGLAPSPILGMGASGRHYRDAGSCKRDERQGRFSERKRRIHLFRRPSLFSSSPKGPSSFYKAAFGEHEPALGLMVQQPWNDLIQDSSC